MARSTSAQASKKAASGDTFLILGNARRDGVSYKQGERVTLDSETQAEFAKLGLIELPLASDVAAKPSDDQTQGSDNNQGGTEGNEGGEGSKNEKTDDAKAGKETK